MIVWGWILLLVGEFVVYVKLCFFKLMYIYLMLCYVKICVFVRCGCLVGLIGV